MSFFGPSVAASGVNRVSTLTVQTSAYGVAIQRAWGTARIAGNLIWYGDFTSTAQSGGGKGGASFVAGYSYTTSVQIGLCDNQIFDVLASWENKTKCPNPSNVDTSIGMVGQSPWAYLTSRHPEAALSYPGLAWAAIANGNLGQTPSLPSMSFEVKTITAGAGGSMDASPVDVVKDIMDSSGFPADRIGNLSAYTDFVFSYGLFISPVIDQQQRAGDHLDKIFEMTCSAPFFSEGKLKVVPYGDTAKDGNGRSFLPDLSPSYSLTDDDFLAIEGEALPIRIVRKAPADQKNTLRIEYQDRALEYNSNTVEVQDDAHAAQFGRRSAETRTYNAIKAQSVAQMVAWLQMQRGLYVCNTYEFKLGLRFCRLEPMDILSLTHAGLGLSAAPVRVLDVEDAPDGSITVTAEDFVQGAGLAPTVPSPPSSGYSTNANVPPGNAAAPVVFEPPLQLAGEPEIWLATSGGANYGGCDVWVSFDGTTYKKIGTHAAKSRFGVTTAVFPAGADPDTTSTLSVDLTASGGILSGGLAQDRDTFNTLCWVGGELVSYQTSTLVAAGCYNLTSLRRGAYGSPVSAHASGVPFVRLDSNVFRYPYDPSLVGKTIYLKLQAFNIFGAAYQDLAALSPVAYTVQGYPPPNLSGYAVTTAGDGTRVHTWSASASVVSGAVVEVRFSASAGANWSSMSVLGQAPYGGGRLEVQTPAAGTWTFEARIRDTFGAISATGARTTVTLGSTYAGDLNATYGANGSNLNVGIGTNLLANTEFVGSMAPAVMGWNPGGCGALYLVTGGSWIPVGCRGIQSYLLGRNGNAYNVGCDVYLTGGYGQAAYGIPVVAGRRYEFSAKVASHRCDVAICIDFFDANNVLCGSTGAPWVARNSGGNALSANANGTGFGHAIVFGTAPSNAVYASIFWRRSDTDAGQGDSYAWLTQPLFGEAGAAQTVPSTYSPGYARGAMSSVDQITSSNVSDLVASGAMGTAQMAPSAVNVGLAASASNVTVTGDSVSGTWTSLCQVVFVAPVSCDVDMLGDVQYGVLTPATKSDYGSGYSRLGLRISVTALRPDGVYVSVDYTLSDGEDLMLVGLSATRVGSLQINAMLPVVEGYTYTVVLKGQKYTSSPSCYVSLARIFARIKKR